MNKFKENFVVDEKGKPIGVILDIAEYRKLMEEIEELESIRAYNDAKAAKDEAVPFEQAISEIEQTR
jgi:PHD/YefM family antitoxin component YafN of YafNO toxin-antitoxin module